MLPATPSVMPPFPQDEPGMGAQRLCSMMAEAASRSLVTRWGEGHRSFVQAMLLLPDASSASSTEQQVGQGEGKVRGRGRGTVGE